MGLIDSIAYFAFDLNSTEVLIIPSINVPCYQYPDPFRMINCRLFRLIISLYIYKPAYKDVMNLINDLALNRG